MNAGNYKVGRAELLPGAVVGFALPNTMSDDGYGSIVDRR